MFESRERPQLGDAHGPDESSDDSGPAGVTRDDVGKMMLISPASARLDSPGGDPHEAPTGKPKARR